MASALQTIAAKLSVHLQGIAPGGQLHSLRLEDGTVTLNAADNAGQNCVLNVLYTEPERYPTTGALVLCEGNSKLTDKFSALTERFQDRASLPQVVAQVGIQKSGGSPTGLV